MRILTDLEASSVGHSPMWIQPRGRGGLRSRVGRTPARSCDSVHWPVTVRASTERSAFLPVAGSAVSITTSVAHFKVHGAAKSTAPGLGLQAL